MRPYRLRLHEVNGKMIGREIECQSTFLLMTRTDDALQWNEILLWETCCAD